jgi:hypothetical protein
VTEATGHLHELGGRHTLVDIVDIVGTAAALHEGHPDPFVVGRRVADEIDEQRADVDRFLLIHKHS